jgi:CBS domain-containing protein
MLELGSQVHNLARCVGIGATDHPRSCFGNPETGSDRTMKVKDGMSQVVLSVGPAHTLRQAARMMATQRVGAAVVLDHERSGIGILTERDILNSLGANQDPDAEVVANHRTSDIIFASPDWTLDHAAQTMVAGGFRHLIVIDEGEVTGLLSMRDIVRCWSDEPPGKGRKAAVASGSRAGS